jgi:hypothetical protein
MNLKQGYIRNKILIWTVVVIVVGGGLYLLLSYKTPSLITPPIKNPINTYGMSKYDDSNYGFSFWYPSALQITTTATQDNTSFPGGTAVENLQIGSMGSTTVFVVNSPTSTITDEPSDHASPIGQTEYFYDKTTQQWMVTFPQGNDNGGSSTAITVANISKITMSGLIMLPSGKRFDTTIIPINTNEFLVITDGGGSSFTSELAETVAQANTSVNTSLQATILQAEAAAYFRTAK